MHFTLAGILWHWGPCVFHPGFGCVPHITECRAKSCFLLGDGVHLKKVQFNSENAVHLIVCVHMPLKSLRYNVIMISILLLFLLLLSEYIHVYTCSSTAAQLRSVWGSQQQHRRDKGTNPDCPALCASPNQFVQSELLSLCCTKDLQPADQSPVSLANSYGSVLDVHVEKNTTLVDNCTVTAVI